MSSAVEEKWSKRWVAERVFEADPVAGKEKVFLTVPYPYMNGPLHVGHGFTFLRMDVYARYKMMKGFNTLFPMAWHWTGEAVAGISRRIEDNDENLIRALITIDGVPEEEVRKFVSPLYLAEYYTKMSAEFAKRLGLSIDWRREFYTTSHNLEYSKFIEWQYLRLAKLGYVTRGTHPVVWCPRDKSPTGDHDRLIGEGVSPDKYTIVFFKPEGSEYSLAAATFRPETVFGTTNVWVNPEGVYVEAEIDGNKLIVSKAFAEKIVEQERSVVVLREFRGSELVGKSCFVPLLNRWVPILPALFVDVEVASGAVYSVPAHAPYDWLALRDLAERGLGDLREIARSLQPISIISTEGFGEFPAIEVVEKMNVRDQLDPKAREATDSIYSKEFHLGVMKDNCGKFSGLPVRVAKERVAEELIKLGLGDEVLDLPELVVCRCGAKCIVKILRDQWFLKYSDEGWKNKVREYVSTMRFYPEEARAWMLAIVDWLGDWACARRGGMGTPLPWDPSWIVETLSDSTVYQAYYIISKYVNLGLIKHENMVPEFFDYVFLGEGDVGTVSEKTGLSTNLLEKVRNEFLYWYPVDVRNSAKELIPNHLTFYVFHHVALFPPELWPRAISVNGMMNIEGKKMSKSKGIFVPLHKAIEEFGADAVRATLIYTAENMDDASWVSSNAAEMRQKVRFLSEFIASLPVRSVEKEQGIPERQLLSSFRRNLLKMESALEEMRTKSAFQSAFFDILNDVRDYLRWAEEPERRTIERIVKAWIKVLSLFTPYMAEELWEKMGEPAFVSTSSWPRLEEFPESRESEAVKFYLDSLAEDVREIMKVITPTRRVAWIYVSPSWIQEPFLAALSARLEGLLPEKGLGQSMAKLPLEKRVKIQRIFKKIVSYVNSIKEEHAKEILERGLPDEMEILLSNKSYMERLTGLKINVVSAEQATYDPAKRSELALPLKPAIYLE